MPVGFRGLGGLKRTVGAKLEVDVVETCSVDPGPQQYHAAPRRVLQHMRAHTTREGTGQKNTQKMIELIRTGIHRLPPTDRALGVSDCPRRQDGHGIALSSATMKTNYF